MRALCTWTLLLRQHWAQGSLDKTPDSDAPQGPQLKTPSYAQAQGTPDKTPRL